MSGSSNESDRDKPYRLLLLCQSRAGYLRLCELLTRAYRSNQYRGRAEIASANGSRDCGTDGLIALSGAHHGEVGQALLAGNAEQARSSAQRMGGAYFRNVSTSSCSVRGHAAARTSCVQASPCTWHPKLKLPVVATHPGAVPEAPKIFAHTKRGSASLKATCLSDQRRPRHFTEEQYFKTQAEMAELFADIPQALDNSVEIAQALQPRRSSSANRNCRCSRRRTTRVSTTILRDRAAAGPRRAHACSCIQTPRSAPRKSAASTSERLEFEIKTILQMGFPGYFLIVADFINWAKTNGVPVGPGRGSGAGSLVAYSLGITDLDPLRYNLLFERFLNPERVSMPDFDIDFCQDGRDRVIEYVRQKYGADRVSQIVTFGTMAAKAVVRDVGRVHGMELQPHATSSPN